MEWTPDLGNDESFVFELMKADLEDILKSIYAQEPGFKKIEILSFSQGNLY